MGWRIGKVAANGQSDHYRRSAASLVTDAEQICTKQDSIVPPRSRAYATGLYASTDGPRTAGGLWAWPGAGAYQRQAYRPMGWRFAEVTFFLFRGPWYGHAG